MKKYLDLLKAFQQWNPELIQQMNQCSHHFNSDNLNIYHAEGSVWTHTMLAYKNFIDFINDDRNKESSLLKDGNKTLFFMLAISILCHDIGKVFCRSSENKGGKVSFFGHAFASIQGTIDFIYFLKEKGVKFNNNDVYAILVSISNHIDYFDANLTDQLLMANNDRSIYLLLSWLNYFDRRNSLNDESINGEPLPTPFDFAKIKEVTTTSIPKVSLYCGVPGVGKDTLALKQKLEIVSYDDIRIEKYLKLFPEAKHLEESDLYRIAWEYVVKNKIDLNVPLTTKVKALDTSVAICNTHLTRRLRRSIMGSVNEKEYSLVYMVGPSKVILNRNYNRVYKRIDNLEVTKCMYNQQVPSFFDFRDSNIKVSGIDLIMI